MGPHANKNFTAPTPAVISFCNGTFDGMTLGGGPSKGNILEFLPAFEFDESY